MSRGDPLGFLVVVDGRPLVDSMGNAIICRTRIDAEAMGADVLGADKVLVQPVVRWAKPRQRKPNDG